LILCDQSKKILVVGQVFIDRHLDRDLLRLGGVFHVARALHALQANYAVAHACPEYLDRDCSKYFGLLNCRTYSKIGNVTGVPNVIEIKDSEEAGKQAYNDLLGAARKVQWNLVALEELITLYDPTDVLVIGDSHDLAIIDIIVNSNARVHVDTDHDISNLWGASKGISTAFCSTSGASFARADHMPSAVRFTWSSLQTEKIVLKENRGGSRLWMTQEPTSELDAPAYPTNTQHSVGVGDCFDAVWVASPENESPRHRLRACSYISSLYASTFEHARFVDDVKTAAAIATEVVSLVGIRIPWEDRPSRNIYLAAPDFPHIDIQKLQELSAALTYHNFSPRRPIQENGFAHAGISQIEGRSLYTRDVELMERCQLLIAIAISDDPGTFVELGWFSADGKSTILYDPYRRVTNVFALNAATRVCFTPVSVVDAVFELLRNPFYV
jgi:hypothetical protein